MVVEHKGTQFRVVWQGGSVGWWEDTPSNRKAMVVFLRSMRDELGKRKFTLAELAQVVGSENRQAAHQHMEGFRESGGDMLGYLSRKRKVAGEVVAAVEEELREDLWISLEELARRVNVRLGREDLTGKNMAAALEQVSGRELWSLFMGKVERGKAHFKESYVLDRLFSLALGGAEGGCPGGGVEVGVLGSLEEGTEPIGCVGCGEREELGEREQEMAEALLEGREEGVSKEEVSSLWEGVLGVMVWAYVLYMQGISMSVIGGWLGRDKSTICRWLSLVGSMGRSWMEDLKVAFSGQASIDEKWVKIAGVWWYLFAAVDCVTGYPLHVALYPSNSGIYCKLFLLELKRKGYIPKAIITDGWDAYIQAIASVFPQAEHLLCRFHLIRSVFRRLRKAGVWKEEVWQLVGQLFRTPDKRTVRRRVEKLCGVVDSLGVGDVVSGLVRKLPQVIGAVGSTWRPSTSNAVEGFFRAFDRFYRIKGPFCDVESAQKHVQLFVLWYAFSLGASGQACPLEKAGGVVADIPFYHLINRPNVLLLRDRMAPHYRLAA